MKKQLLIFTVIFLVLNNGAEAQKRKSISERSPATTISKEALETIPFKRNQWEIANTVPNLGISSQKNEVNGNDAGKQSSFFLGVGANYYVTDGFAVGAEVDYSSTTFKNNGNKQVNTSWMSYANLTYGLNVSPEFNLFGRFGAGVGGVATKYTPNIGTGNKNTSTLSGIKFTVGAPIRLDENVFLTPQIDWMNTKEKFDDGTQTENSFGFGLGLNSYLRCNAASCASTKAYRTQHTMYYPGRSFLGVTTRGGFNFGKWETKYDNNFPSSEQRFSNYDLSVNYNYFVAKNLSVGLGGSINNSYFKNEMSNFSNCFFGYQFGPNIEFNLPSENRIVNNFFLRTGAAVGGQRYESKSGSNENVTKYSTTDIYGGIGHNCFFGRKLALTTILDYNSNTVKEKDTNDKEKHSGLNFSVGIRKYFD